MAAPVATFVQLPTDASNTGKKVRTISRVVGSDTVHEHYFIPNTPRSILGRYFVSSGVLTSQLAAHNGTSTGFYWIINPAGSSVKVAMLSTEAVLAASAITAAQTTSTRVVLSLFTATGSPSGAQNNYAKRDSTDANPVSSMRTAVTGLTVTLGNILRAWLFPAITGTTGVGLVNPVIWPERNFEWDEHPVLRAGEGAVCWQADASTLATMKAQTNHYLEEFE
jgi:hypothetical protein